MKGIGIEGINKNLVETLQFMEDAKEDINDFILEKSDGNKRNE